MLRKARIIQVFSVSILCIPEDELDAIWFDGYEQDSIDSAYDCIDKGYAIAIDDFESWRYDKDDENSNF